MPCRQVYPQTPVITGLPTDSSDHWFTHRLQWSLVYPQTPVITGLPTDSSDHWFTHRLQWSLVYPQTPVITGLSTDSSDHWFIHRLQWSLVYPQTPVITGLPTDSSDHWFTCPVWQITDTVVKCWMGYCIEVQRRRSLPILFNYSQGNSDVAWSQDSKYLVSASDDKTCKIWEAATVRATSRGCFYLHF